MVWEEKQVKMTKKENTQGRVGKVPLHGVCAFPWRLFFIESKAQNISREENLPKHPCLEDPLRFYYVGNFDCRLTYV